MEELAAANEEKEDMKEEIVSLKVKMKKEQEAAGALFDKLLELMHGEPSSRKEHVPQSS